MLTLFVSRVEVLKHESAVPEDEKPTQEELVQWYGFK